MADFRKMLYAFALGALAIGVTVPASAQQMTCNSTAVDPIIRAESYTDLGGDYIVTCTGGTPTTAGTAVPGVTITLFTNGVITSRITNLPLNTNGNPNFLEALLIVDDPNTTFNNSTGVANLLRHPILACGTGSTTVDQGNTGECDVLATGLADTAYDGTNQVVVPTVASSRPNIFQGQTVPNSNNSAVQFIGVPLDPPGPGKIHTFRITNVRLSGVTASGGSGQVTGFGGLFQVQAFVSFTTPNSVATQTNTLPIATIRNGLAPVTGVNGGSYPQCGPFSITVGENTVNGAANGGSITVTEGFASSFKPRNWALISANGAYTGGSDWHYTATPASLVTNAVDVNQNVPGVYYSTEAGFEYTGPGTAFASPNQNPPAGISSSPGTACDNLAAPVLACTPAGDQPFTSTNGLWNTGIASNGTRFVFTFANVPIGSGATVPPIIALYNSGNLQTGVMVYVAGADANGAGGTISPTTAPPTLTEGGPATNIVYEVIFADFIQVESATVPVTLTPVVNLGAVTPVNGTPQIGVIATGTAGFAPFYSPSFTPAPAAPEQLYPTAGGLPIPRFINETNNVINMWQFNKCACDIMFPWVVADGTFNTSIVVANTSLDPGRGVGNLSFGNPGALPQSGNVTWWFYGTDDAPSVGPGGSVSHNGSAVDNSGQNTTLTTTNAAYSLTTFNLIPPGSYAVLSVSTNAGVAAAGTPVISNAISNPTGAASTVGTQILQPPVPAGATSGEPTGFAGYVIAQSQFRYCHGIAAIHANQAGFGTQTYLGLILDNGSQLPARTSNLGEVLGN